MKPPKFLATTIHDYLTEQQANSDLNDNFWKWFGDSKVTKNNKPLAVYHGTTKKFDKFDKSKQIFGHHGKGFYFGDKNYAQNYYGKDYISVYLKIDNLFDLYAYYTIDDIKKIFGNELCKVENIIEEELQYSDTIQGYLFYTIAGNDKLRKAGYDGLKHDYVYVVFEPNQIKSVENDGSWDINDDNIYS